MFAFSQIIAAGGNPLAVASQIEKEQAAVKPKGNGNALDDDT